MPGEERPPPAKPFCARVAGFSLHAGQAVHADDREALERLCRYGLRAPFSQERLYLRDDGRVVYFLRRPWPNAKGVNSLVLEPHELLRRLAALVPAPYAHTIRYHGVFASRAKLRPRLPAPPPPLPPPADEHETLSATTPLIKPAPRSKPTLSRSRRRRVPWAELLRRVLFLDALSCARCSTPMVVLAFLSNPPVVTKILRHLGLPDTAPPLAPAAPVGDEAYTEGDLFSDSARAPP